MSISKQFEQVSKTTCNSYIAPGVLVSRNHNATSDKDGNVIDKMNYNVLYGDSYNADKGFTRAQVAYCSVPYDARNELLDNVEILTPVICHFSLWRGKDGRISMILRDIELPDGALED